jgi:hypothetical protein
MDGPPDPLDARATPLPSVDGHSASVVVAFIPRRGEDPARVQSDPVVREAQQTISAWEWDPHEDWLVASELVSSTTGGNAARRCAWPTH